MIVGGLPETSTGLGPGRLVRPGSAAQFSETLAGDPGWSPRWTLKTALGRASPVQAGALVDVLLSMSRRASVKVETELERFLTPELSSPSR